MPKNSMTIGFDLPNFAETAALLRELPASVESRVMGDAVGVALKPLQADARARAPRESGALKRSISVKVKRYPNTGKIVGLVGPSKEYFSGGVRVKAGQSRRGANRPSNYAHLVEYGHHVVAPIKGTSRRKYSARPAKSGTTWVAARPFLRPAYAAQKGAVISGLGNGVAKGIEREGKRLASKLKRVTKG
jgi:HK97 gp10 family phage protein